MAWAPWWASPPSDSPAWWARAGPRKRQAQLTNPVTHVSDTARWVAVYRAMESERADALFRDPYARRLAGPQGEAIVRHMPRGRSWAWPMIVRTAVMDEIIMRLVERKGVTTVVNLASGLDTRPYRLALPSQLRWFDVDLPDMIGYKREALAGETPRCALEYVAADLSNPAARRAALARVGGGGEGGGSSTGRTLAIAEGLLVYLTDEQVRELAGDLAAQPGVAWWLMDLASPQLLQMLQRSWGKKLAQGNAPMRFAPAEGTKFFAPQGWTEAEYRPIMDEAVRLKRAPRMAWLWRITARFASPAKREQYKRFSGIVLLQRTGASP